MLQIALVLTPCWTIHQPPLGIAYLKSALNKGGFKANIYDFGIDLYNRVPSKFQYMFEMSNNSHWTYKFYETRHLLDLDKHIDRWTNILLESNPAIIGFSLFWTTSEITLLLAENIKKKDPSKIIIFGGPSCMKEERAYDFIHRDYVDIVVIREGEETILEIAEIFLRREKSVAIKGTLMKHENQIIDVGERNLIRDLNSISFPDFDGFNLNLYASCNSLPIITSRGCVGHCTFCSEINFWNSYRFRSAENIFNEMKINHDRYGTKKFWFVDSLINGNINELLKLCQLIIDNNLKIEWGGMARIDKRMNFDLLKKMKKAGCCDLDFGIESGSQKVINDMRKGMSVEAAERVLKDTYAAGIRANCMFLIGYPTESFMDFMRTIKFVLKNRKYINRVAPGSGCGIPPGSYLSKHLKELNIEMGDNYSDWKTRDGKNTLKTRRNRVGLFKKLGYLPGICMEKNDN